MSLICASWPFSLWWNVTALFVVFTPILGPPTSPRNDIELKFRIELCARNATSTVLKRIIILGRIEYRILFVWWKLNESNIKYYSVIKKIFEYYSNIWKYSNIRIYSNKFAKKCKGFGIQNFYIPQKQLLIRKNFPHVDSHQ